MSAAPTLIPFQSRWTASSLAERIENVPNGTIVDVPGFPCSAVGALGEDDAVHAGDCFRQRSGNGQIAHDDLAPLIIGAILGPLAETQLRRAMSIADGDFGALISTPFSIVAYVIVILVAIVPQVMKRWERRTAKEVGVLQEFEHASAAATDRD